MTVHLVKYDAARKALAEDTDAVVIGNLYRKARQSMVDSVRCLLECGQRLLAKKAEVGHGNWLAWVESNADALGFNSIRTADRLREFAAFRMPGGAS